MYDIPRPQASTPVSYKKKHDSLYLLYQHIGHSTMFTTKNNIHMLNLYDNKLKSHNQNPTTKNPLTENDTARNQYNKFESLLDKNHHLRVTLHHRCIKLFTQNNCESSLKKLIDFCLILPQFPIILIILQRKTIMIHTV